MKRLLLAPLFLTLFFSPCKGQQFGEKKYNRELKLAQDEFVFIAYMIEEYKDFVITVKEAYPDAAKEYIEKAMDLRSKLTDLIDYQKCLNKKFKEKIIFKIGKAECIANTGVDLSNKNWMIQ